MKLRQTTITVLAVGTLSSIACWRGSASRGTTSVEATTGGVSKSSQLSESCWVKKWPRPQGLAYRHQKLQSSIEGVEYIYSHDVTLGTARVHFSEAECADDVVTLTPAGFRQVGDAQMPLFHATDPSGNNLCQSQNYEPTSRERSLLGCPATGRCSPVADLQGVAVLVPGAWRDGAWSLTQNGVPVQTLSCVTGATAKCALWGYVPGWNHQNTELAPYYQACVRAMRAMYTEGALADNSYTCPNTEVEVYDRLNLQRRQTTDLPVESLWSENGRLCINHSRYMGCEKELVGLIDGACVDPAPGPGSNWSSLADSRALIAVGSSTTNNIFKCPTYDCTPP
ncbi:ADYC domain-containing protein [Myxococcus stipitatus]|uniref:ADYC domain-containing protein n=1 Tax=Myxococcus stipitatus TaxID=83455 RepID=UPI0030CD65A4